MQKMAKQFLPQHWHCALKQRTGQRLRDLRHSTAAPRSGPQPPAQSRWPPPPSPPREAPAAPYLKEHFDELSADSKNRLERNPLRVLDSKEECDKAVVEKAPLYADSLNEKSKAFFAKVLDGLDRLGIKYRVNNRLVRGLDYYSHTVFELVTDKLGAQGTVLAGGRYDGLVEQMGGGAVEIGRAHV